MIHLPRRSVTRFFIPLIDVMILLFCIFLLLPIFKENDPESPGTAENLKLKKENERLLAELAEERRGKRKVVVRVLEIDPVTGNLFYYRRGEPKAAVLSKDRDVTALIKDHESELRANTTAGNVVPDQVYLLLYPPPTDKSGIEPVNATLEKYQKWFGKTPYSLDRRGS